ncbi:MAG: hypothetical protein EOM41_06335 [Bacilli bacterium]|nr:hypothetical protein [Bacilli bacterium]
MSRLFLQETAKYKDLVDLTLCCMLYKVCNCRQFEHMKGSEFVDFMNLKSVSAKICFREKNRVCYLLYMVSKRFDSPILGQEWLSLILEACQISPEYYRSHYKDAVASGAGDKNKEFVSDVKNAFNMANNLM